ncbi:MAG: glutaredoxin family protein [Gammaproteobacteria bacterium]|nr:glutaredoxin family protein [Gammaproteobacteria bacterium]
MKPALTAFLIVPAVAAWPAAAQRTLYKVVDQYGNVTYQDQPPAEGASFETRTIEDPQSGETVTSTEVGDDERVQAASESRPLVLFTVPRCDPCDFVRWFLDDRQLPYEEINVESDIENQRRLRESTGEFRVPVLMVGEVPVFGYDREDLVAELETAGYLAPAAEPEAAPGEVPGSADAAADAAADAGVEVGEESAAGGTYQ